jgi:undecaprenyl-diphosphatase
MAIDWLLLKSCNDLAGQSSLVSALTRALVNDYAVTTALALLMVILWFSGESAAFRVLNQRAVLSAVAAVFSTNVLIKLLNLAYYRPRPFATHSLKLLFYRPSDSSFPSNAAAVAFSVATAVWLFNRNMGKVMYVLAFLLGLARLCSGVHYPTDIVGGILLGVLSAYVIVKKVVSLDRLWLSLIRGLRRLLLA